MELNELIITMLDIGQCIFEDECNQSGLLAIIKGEKSLDYKDYNDLGEYAWKFDDENGHEVFDLLDEDNISVQKKLEPIFLNNFA